MLEKIIKKDKNEELERILEEKKIDEHAKNLLQGILYKIENSYKDYQKAKGIEETEEEYVSKLILDIKKNCNNITVVKLSQKLADEELQKELRKNKFHIEKKDIISYPIEEKILYAIGKLSNNKKILNNKYGIATITVSNFINEGRNIDRVEVLRDFNGWSWTTIKTELENIDANLSYQILQILFGQKFMNEWCQDNDGIVDYFEVMIDDFSKKYGKENIENLKNLLIKLSIINSTNVNKEFAENISKKINELNQQIKEYEDTKAYIEKIAVQKKDIMKKLKDIEKILGQDERLKIEYEKINKEAPLDKKIFNIRVLKQSLNEQKQKLLNQIEEYNYMLIPKNYLEEKNIKIKEKELLDISKLNQNQKEELIIEFIKVFLHCMKLKIEETDEAEDIIKMIYKFRYFMMLPFNLEKKIKEVKELQVDIIKTEKILVKKAKEKKVISNLPFEIMKHVFETRIIILEELYYKITIEAEKYYVQIFDENISEEKFEILPVEKTKINKKIKIFI